MGECLFVCAGVSSNSGLPTQKLKNILLSAANIGASKSAKKKYKTFLDELKPKLFIMDSGGYQLLLEVEKVKKSISSTNSKSNNNLLIRVVKNLNLSPKKIIELAVEFHPNIMIGLDFPVGKYSSPSEQKNEFCRKIGFNIDWALEIDSLRKKYCLNIQYFLPIQAYTLEQFYWFWHYVKGVEIDGVSLPTRNMSVETLVQFLLAFHHVGVRKVHILGTSRFDYFAVGAYFAKNYFNWLSIDGTSWSANARYGSYMNPHDLKNEYLGKEAVLNESYQIDCRCPWCRYYDFPAIQSLVYTEKSRFLGSHNFWITNRCLENLYNNAGDLHSFYRYIRQEFRDQSVADEIYFSLLKADGKRH